MRSAESVCPICREPMSEGGHGTSEANGFPVLYCPWVPRDTAYLMQLNDGDASDG